MNEGLNDFFVRLKYNKEVEALEAVFIICTAALVLGSIARVNLRTPATIFFIATVILRLLSDVIRSLREYDDDVIRKNRKIDIVFSVNRTVTDYIFYILFIIIFIMSKFVKDFNWAMIFILIALSVIFLPKKVAKHFKDKIVK